MQLLTASLVLSAFLGGSWAQVTLTVCPDGWVAWQTYCYKFFNNATDKIGWSQAGYECSIHQGHLLRIETHDEYDFVKKNLDVYPSDAYWTALNDKPMNQGLATKPVFMWGNDEFPLPSVVDQHWDKEPDNTPSKDCVQVSIQATMTVEDCSNKHAYICEIQRTSSEQCPDGWTDTGAGLNHCYLPSSTNWTALATWANARKICEGMRPFGGGDTRKAKLISITDKHVQDYLASYLPGVQNTRQVYWTGMNDIDTEGTFVWAGSATQTQVTNAYVWRVEPNNLAGNEHCGALLPGGRWSDANCADRKSYICRIALNSKTLYNFGCGQWTRAGQSCVYVYNSHLKTWKDARSYCQLQGGDLYKFSSRDDLMWLSTQAQRLLYKPGYYIGLNDQATENTFVWADGSSSDAQFLDWDKQPNNNGGGQQPENCAKMSVEGKFSSGTCQRTKAGAICEVKSGVCVAPWVPYQGSCYFFDVKFRTHDEAQDNCRDTSAGHNAGLFALNSQAEKDWLLSHVAAMAYTPYQFWSDLNQESGDGWQYTLVADDDATNIQNLATWDSEPNDYKGAEDCVQVDANGHLNDVNCSSRAPYICQKNLYGGATESSVLSRPLLLLVLCLGGLLVRK